MIDRPRKGKIILAVDILEDPVVQRPVARVAELWAQGVGLEVQPTYVFGASSDRFRAERAAVAQELKARFAKFLAGVGMPRSTAFQVLFSDGASLRGRVAALLTHACEVKAAAIALTTRARTGVSRWAFGSFTETMVLNSRLPLLTLNPEARPIQRQENILFATDLCEESDRVLRVVLEEAKSRGLALTIAHCSQFDQAHPEAAFGPPVGYIEGKAKYLKKKRAQLDEQVRVARDSGLAADGVFLEEECDAAGALLKLVVRRKIQMVAMASRCGPVAAALGGSMTRKVIRAAHCPVLALYLDR